LSLPAHFADQGNWYSAGPLYAKAETEYHRTGDARNELYAKFGRLHRDVESGSYRTVRAEVTNALGSPAAQADLLLRILGLALLGSIDLNTTTSKKLYLPRLQQIPTHPLKSTAPPMFH
jgi:hypothetical protein